MLKSSFEGKVVISFDIEDNKVPVWLDCGVKHINLFRVNGLA